MARKPAPDLLADLQDSKQNSKIESNPASNISTQQDSKNASYPHIQAESKQDSSIPTKHPAANRLQLNARVPSDVLVALGEAELALLAELGRRIPRQDIIAEALRIGLSDRQRLWQALDNE